jgi:hypothetical protein
MKPCNSAFWKKDDRSKTMTDKCWQKDVLHSKFNQKSKFEIKMGPHNLKKNKNDVDFRKSRHLENILFELGAVDYSRLIIFIVIRFWEIRKFLTNALPEISLYNTYF